MKKFTGVSLDKSFEKLLRGMVIKESHKDERELRILIVEDSADDLELILHELKRADIRFKFTVACDKAEYTRALVEFEPQIIISDHSLPRFNSIEALSISQAHAKRTRISIPFILVTGSVSEEFAVQIIKSGADDYILKDRLKRLPTAVLSAIEKSKVENENSRAQTDKQEIFDILQKSFNEIYIFDPDSLQYKYVNDSALANLGYEREETARLTPLDIQYQLSREEFKSLLDSLNENPAEKQMYETYHRRKNGTSYIANIHLQSVMHGQQKSILAVVSDISDLKGYLTKLDSQTEQLKSIAWIQSHEVRGPLSRVMGLTMLIARREKGIDPDNLVGALLKSASELDDVIRKIVRRTEDPGESNQPPS